MAVQLSVEVRDARLDALEVEIGTAPILRIYDLTAGAPANTAAAIVGTVLAEMTLPSNWLADAGTGAKAIAGTWEDLSANAAGTADFFRIYNSGDTICHIQGTVTATGGGGDMTLDNAVIASAQKVTVTTFTLTDGNA